MAHHDDSHNDHGHDMTEGKRQYYTKGWFIPLVGLVIVAFAFSAGAGAILGISGTDKWGKKECCEGEKCEGHEGMDAKTDGHATTTTATGDRNSDSVNIVSAPPVSDCTKVDSPAKAEPASVEVDHK